MLPDLAEQGGDLPGVPAARLRAPGRRAAPDRLRAHAPDAPERGRPRGGRPSHPRWRRRAAHPTCSSPRAASTGTAIPASLVLRRAWQALGEQLGRPLVELRWRAVREDDAPASEGPGDGRSRPLERLARGPRGLEVPAARLSSPTTAATAIRPKLVVVGRQLLVACGRPHLREPAGVEERVLLLLQRARAQTRTSPPAGQAARPSPRDELGLRVLRATPSSSRRTRPVSATRDGASSRQRRGS